jgi:hypothetical protein
MRTLKHGVVLVQAAEKARVCQEEERIKMRELTAEESEGNEDEAVMLHKLEDMIGKGNEAGCALVFLQHSWTSWESPCDLSMRLSLWSECPLLCLQTKKKCRCCICMLANESSERTARLEK